MYCSQPTIWATILLVLDGHAKLFITDSSNPKFLFCSHLALIRAQFHRRSIAQHHHTSTFHIRSLHRQLLRLWLRLKLREMCRGDQPAVYCYMLINASPAMHLPGHQLSVGGQFSAVTLRTHLPVGSSVDDCGVDGEVHLRRLQSWEQGRGVLPVSRSRW